MPERGSQFAQVEAQRDMEPIRKRKPSHQSLLIPDHIMSLTIKCGCIPRIFLKTIRVEHLFLELTLTFG